jgi:metal-responsive CopG/Arc/MetJ family transcriptional regulator
VTKKRLLRSQLVTLRIPRDLLKGVDLIALEQERYRSEILVDAVKLYLKQDEAHKSARRITKNQESSD